MEEQAFIAAASKTIFDNGAFRIIAVLCILYTAFSFALFVFDLFIQLFDLIGRILGRFISTSKRFVLATIAVLTIFWLGFILGSVYCECQPVQTLFF